MKEYADLLVYFGQAIKVSEGPEGTTLSGLAVVFDNDGEGRDTQGEYFTADTYYGAAAKSGQFVSDGMFHHGIPIADDPRAVKLADTLLPEVKMELTEAGWLASMVLPMREEYEQEVAKLAKDGKLGWSTGSAPHAVRKNTDGQITRWPIVEVSLTPTPAEPRTYAVPLKSLLDTPEDPVLTALKTINANHDLARALRQVA